MQGPLVHLLLWAAARERLLAPTMWAVLVGSVRPGTARMGGQQLLQAWGYKPEFDSCLHGLCTRGDVTPPGTGTGGSSLGSCAGHGVELRSGCFAFPASAHAAFLCWSYAEKLRFMYCMKKQNRKKEKILMFQNKSQYILYFVK